ncbi:MAG: hypothetical protein ACT4TC_14925 [Myxococcaceae bacterium]
MLKRAQAIWLTLCCLAALAIIASQVLGNRPKAPPLPPPRAELDGGGCEVPAEISVRPNSTADAPPSVLVAVPPVKLFLDGEPVYAGADAPRQVRAGEHELRAEAPGEAPLVTRLRVDAFTPFLVHAERSPSPVGITLLRAGTVCVSCASPLNDVKLDFRKQAVRAPALLATAAEALRKDDWANAAEALRGVPVKARKDPLFLRLASAVHSASLQPELSKQEAAASSVEVKVLLEKLDTLKLAEGTRRHSVLLARWNKLTERFGAVTQRFQPDAPGAVAAGSSRFDSLSKAFEVAARGQKVTEEDELVGAAEVTLVTLVGQIRRARPEDCLFQTEVVATALRSRGDRSHPGTIVLTGASQGRLRHQSFVQTCQTHCSTSLKKASSTACWPR